MAEPGRPPYWVVVFTSVRGPADMGYDEVAEHLETLVRDQPGYLGMDTARTDDGLGITVSYWADEASIARWRHQADHVLAQERGRQEWYTSFTVHVARVERAYHFDRAQSSAGTPPS